MVASNARNFSSVRSSCRRPRRSRSGTSSFVGSSEASIFSSDSIGWRCSTRRKPSEGVPPTRWLGESAVARPGNSFSNARSSAKRASYSRSETAGEAST